MRDAALTASIDDPHRRYNPLIDEWVLVSVGRTQRPWLGEQEVPPPPRLPAYDPDCYLCPGNPRAGGAINPPYLDTFVFTNDFAALRPDTSTGILEYGLLRAEGQQGTCRVICFSPRHDLSLGLMPSSDVRGVVDLWADQTSELGAWYRWVQVFENRGEAMGASNPHPHGQIWAGSALPREATKELSTQSRHWHDTGRHLLLDYIAQEAEGPRIVEENPSWSIVVPFWAAWPFETLVVARQPAQRLSDLDGQQRSALAEILIRLIKRYDDLFHQPFPYSMGWHQAPFGDSQIDGWQLHAHFYPPLLRSATVRKFMVGYELLAETQRDFAPEQAAERLRSSSSDPAFDYRVAQPDSPRRYG